MLQCEYGINIQNHKCNITQYRPMSVFVNALHVLTEQFKMSLFYLLIFLYTSAMYLPLTTKNAAHANPTQNSTQNSTLQILILGGNGFIGSSLAAKLLSIGRYNVTILNRGRHYFDSKSRIDPYVQRMICDRSDIYKCAELVNSTQYYDAVVDYSSYYMEDMQSILHVLRARFGRYIFISSDSVYEVCVKTSHGGPSREEDAIRPRDPRERHELNMADYYGHQKLACEDVLQNERNLYGINYVSLRLPDIIGPRDTTNRFWNYQIWLLTHQLDGSFGPVHLNPKENKPISLFFSEDLSDLIIKLFEIELDVYNEAYNVAFEPITLEGFIKIMGESLGVDVVFNRTEQANVHWYPSVTRGPVNTTKISEKLNWKPSPLNVAVKSSCMFFQKAMTVPEFEKRRDNIVKKYLPNNDAREKFLKDELKRVSREEL